MLVLSMSPCAVIPHTISLVQEDQFMIHIHIPGLTYCFLDNRVHEKINCSILSTLVHLGPLYS